MGARAAAFTFSVSSARTVNKSSVAFAVGFRRKSTAPAFIAYLDADCVRGELQVRSPRPGDRIRPLGMTGSKKLSDLLSERQVPRPDRGLVPLVVDDEKVLWVAGHVIHHDARVTPTTSRVLRLRLALLA